jgi:steroid delta-isomerase-like uncharacterized protein
MESAAISTIRAANSTLLEEGDTGAVSEFFTTDYVVHLTDAQTERGHAFVRRYLDMIGRAFREIEVSVEILVEAESRVAWQRTLRAHHYGAFLGFPASDRGIVWRDMVVSHFRDRLIEEEWVVSDLAERLLLARKR